MGVGLPFIFWLGLMYEKFYKTVRKNELKTETFPTGSLLSSMWGNLSSYAGLNTSGDIGEDGEGHLEPQKSMRKKLSEFPRLSVPKVPPAFKGPAPPASAPPSAPPANHAQPPPMRSQPPEPPMRSQPPEPPQPQADADVLLKILDLGISADPEAVSDALISTNNNVNAALAILIQPEYRAPGEGQPPARFPNARQIFHKHVIYE